MDYEKLYKEALSRAKELSIDGYLDAVAVESIFPELKESKVVETDNHPTPSQEPHWGKEDENMVKTLADLMKMYYVGYTDKSKEKALLNWLKSLKPRVKTKNKHSPWGKEDEVLWEQVFSKVEFFLWISFLPYKDGSPVITWLKSLKQRLKCR